MEAIMQTLSSEQYSTYFKEGVPYVRFLANLDAELESDNNGPYQVYLPMNRQRMQRLNKTFKPSPEIAEMLNALHKKYHWLVIAEPWCGDVSQILPVIAAFADAAGSNIQLRIAYRDANPELMDAHLTGGVSRSIPVLLQFDENFNLTGSWGPRPSEAQQLVMHLKSHPETAENYSEELHKWYAMDKQRAIQRDLLNLLHLL